MAQQHLDPTDPTVVPADAVADYLRARATEFLRALRTHRETGGAAAAGAEESTDAALALRRSARRISGTLHTFRPSWTPTGRNPSAPNWPGCPAHWAASTRTRPACTAW